ncbi:MAG: lipid II flippase MurJ, partial [Serpentinimonas sp.]|nr:lipid II flippase MurJ [Serpentinimonas sp.]
AIGLGALINAGWLLIGLLRRGSYQPQPGWLVLALQVLAASALLALFLLWGSSQFDWLHEDVVVWQRLLAMLGLLVGAALVYFGTLLLAGVKLKRLVRM